MSESVSYRSIVVASQYLSWLLSQLLRLRYAIRAHGLVQRVPGHCLILAANHQTYVDLGLLMIALGYHGFHALVPIRSLGTQDFRSPVLQRLKPLIKIIYKLEGVIELPPEKHDEKSLPEKLRGMLVALNQGEVVAIFPEGEIWRKREPPIGEFAPGVTYLQRKSGAQIMPIAAWMSERKWLRRRYVVQFGQPIQIPAHLDLEAGAVWLREHVLALHDQLRQGEDQ